MNTSRFPRLVAIGLTLALLVALLAFFARAASAQEVTADSTVRLTLGEAVRIAARQNPQVGSARSRVGGAEARVTQRRADLLPSLSVAARQTGSTINSAAAFPIDFPSAPGEPRLFDPQGSILGPLNVLDARARVSQTLLDASAIGRLRGARTSVQAANADVSTAAESSGLLAANAYLAVLRADAVYGARLADSTLAAELLRIAEDQLRAGTGVALDVTRARSQLTGARTQLIVARNDRNRTRVELARAMGLPLVTLVLVDSLGALPTAAPTTEEAALADALRARSDLRSISLQALAARQQAAAVRNEWLPTVGVFADQGQAYRLGRSSLPTYEWGVQMSLPVFDGFRREGRTEEQLAVAQDFEMRERDLRIQVEADVRIAMLNLTSSTEAVASARERLQLAEQEVAQARERFQAGVSGNADVITASLTLNTARTQYVDALTSYQAARVALARARGSITTID
ncbi:MAG: TolC family protein [Gemmatimonadaceae bacterium]